MKFYTAVSPLVWAEYTLHLRVQYLYAGSYIGGVVVIATSNE